jgi:hypothetical protein
LLLHTQADCARSCPPPHLPAGSPQPWPDDPSERGLKGYLTPLTAFSCPVPGTPSQACLCPTTSWSPNQAPQTQACLPCASSNMGCSRTILVGCRPTRDRPVLSPFPPWLCTARRTSTYTSPADSTPPPWHVGFVRPGPPQMSRTHECPLRTSNHLPLPLPPAAPKSARRRYCVHILQGALPSAAALHTRPCLVGQQPVLRTPPLAPRAMRPLAGPPGTRRPRPAKPWVVGAARRVPGLCASRSRCCRGRAGASVVDGHGGCRAWLDGWEASGGACGSGRMAGQGREEVQ